MSQVDTRVRNGGAGLLLAIQAGPLVLLSVAAVPERAPLHRHEASRMSMACLYAIEAYGPNAEDLARIVDEALDEVDRVDRLDEPLQGRRATSRGSIARLRDIR